MSNNLPEGVLGYECKHAFYSVANDGSNDDLVLMKRNVHYEDGRVEPEVKFVKNYKRDFWVVNENHRTYTEKKAWEDEFKCRKFSCRQSELLDSVTRALGRHPGTFRTLAMAFQSPYVYGADITTTALIKKAHMDKFEDLSTESTVGVMDIETDVVTGDGTEIISASLTFKDTVVLAYTKKFIGQLQDHEKKLQEKYAYYIGGIADDLDAQIAERVASMNNFDADLKAAQQEVTERNNWLVGLAEDASDEEFEAAEEALSDAKAAVNKVHSTFKANDKRVPILKRASAMLRQRSTLKITTKLCNSPAEVTATVFEHAHRVKPDFVAFWNINFDIPKMIKSLEDAGVDPRYVFCDPTLPDRFKSFKYVPGQAIKQKAGGKSSSKHPTELWHKVEASASFYLIDAMCVFKQVRVTEGMRNSYSLDAILRDELDLGKLRFKEADGLSGLDWHIYMQQNHKLEYLIYNIFDCMSIEILDDKTKDLALTVPTLCQHSDYAKFPSTPRRLCDDMHFYLKSYKRVISTTSTEMIEELDAKVVGSDNWIVTLPSHLVDDNGLQLLEEAPHIRSMLRVHVADLDVASSYPNTGSFMNMSMETTERELVKVGDVEEYTKRRAGLNMTAARTNAVECSNVFFKFPTMDELLTEFRRQKNTEAV